MWMLCCLHIFNNKMTFIFIDKNYYFSSDEYMMMALTMISNKGTVNIPKQNLI